MVTKYSFINKVNIITEKYLPYFSFWQSSLSFRWDSGKQKRPIRRICNSAIDSGRRCERFDDNYSPILLFMDATGISWAVLLGHASSYNVNLLLYNKLFCFMPPLLKPVLTAFCHETKNTCQKASVLYLL